MKKITVLFLVCGLCFSGFASVLIGGQAGYSIKSVKADGMDKRDIHGPDVRLHVVFPFDSSLFEIDAGVNLLIGMYGREPNFRQRLLSNQMNADLYALAGLRIPVGNVTSVTLGLGPLVGFSNWKIDKEADAGRGGFMWGLRAAAGFSFNVSKTVSIDVTGGYDNYLYDKAYGWEFKNKRYMGSFDARIGVLVKV